MQSFNRSSFHFEIVRLPVPAPISKLLCDALEGDFVSDSLASKFERLAGVISCLSLGLDNSD